MNPDGRIRDAMGIERDIAQTRRRLSHDLALLDREYALRSILVHALRFARQGKDLPSLAAAAGKNGLPLGLVGIGLAWMTFGDSDHAIGRRLRDAIEQTWRLLETVVGNPPATVIKPSDGHRAGGDS